LGTRLAAFTGSVGLGRQQPYAPPEMIRRIAVAAVALATGVAVSAGLIAYQRNLAGTQSVFALARDVPAGASLTSDALQAVEAGLDPAQAAGLFMAADPARVVGTRARHQLSAGQLLQRSDLEPAGTAAVDALVAVPIKDLPPVHAGDRVDLFALVGGGEHLSAQPFAWSVRVAAVTADGLVLQVQSRQELAFVYAAGALRLSAVLTTAPSPTSGAAPITSPEQALAEALS
jgi:SAF domain